MKLLAAMFLAVLFAGSALLADAATQAAAAAPAPPASAPGPGR